MKVTPLNSHISPYLQWFLGYFFFFCLYCITCFLFGPKQALDYVVFQRILSTVCWRLVLRTSLQSVTMQGKYSMCGGEKACVYYTCILCTCMQAPVCLNHAVYSMAVLYFVTPSPWNPILVFKLKCIDRDNIVHLLPVVFGFTSDLRNVCSVMCHIMCHLYFNRHSLPCNSLAGEQGVLIVVFPCKTEEQISW